MDTDGTEVKHVEGLKITEFLDSILSKKCLLFSSDMVLFSDKLQDGILQEELQQRTLKIERLFRHGLQHSSNVIVPEERIGDDPLSSSTDPLEIEAEAREAEKVFQETLANVMQQKQLPQYLFQLLQQRQSETSAILKHYDDIISMMKKDMNDQDKEYRNRMEKQSDLRELLQARTEDFVSELIRVGNEEIAAAREAIINHTDKSSKEIYAKTQQFLDDTSADQPFDPRSWKAPSDMLTFGTLKDVFISSQEDIFQSRNKSLSKICGQRKDLEKEKLDYALERENLDRELFDMRSEYR
ncbi:uncharacterized protein LOC129232439, partial [Uloborus diversus]|uniref:uncharacterized protein LOC129232439 n=1 Tax=Uloborus diversus TaxID=327109 RepID=UPI002408FE9F